MKGEEYGSRSGESFVDQYGRGRGKRSFVVWHCKDAFESGTKCVDGVCADCKVTYDKNGHKCSECDQSIEDYKMETNISYMPRKRPTWKGPGPTNCAICNVIL